MPVSDYLTGVVFFVPTLVACLAAAVLAVRKRYQEIEGLSRALALSVVATASVIWAYLLPLVFGVLTRGTVLGAAVLILVVAWALPARRPEPDADHAPPVPASTRLSIALAVLAVGVAVIYELARIRGIISNPLTEPDLLAFHVPGVARWIQTGTVWQVDQFIPGFATAQYPNNGDIMILSTVMPWHDLAFARIPAIVFYGLAGAGVFALALELGASRAAAAAFAAMALVVPTIAQHAIDGSPDLLTLSMFAIGVLFLVRHARTRRGGELELAGLALGLSLGAKWFGLTAVAVVAVVWSIARLAVRERRRGLARDGGLLLATMAAGGGFWLLRNLIESGNPLYPKAITVFGVTLFKGSRGDVIDQYGYSLAQYLFKPSVLRQYVYPGFKLEVGFAALVVLIGVVVALVWALRGRRQHGTAMLLALAIVAIGIFVVYLITPASAYGPRNQPVQAFVNIRWWMPGLLVAAALSAAVASKLGRWGVVLELLALAAVADAINRGPSVPDGRVVKIAVAVIAAAVLAMVARRRETLSRLRAERSLAFGLIGAIVVLAVVAGRVDERNFDRRSYAPFDPVFAWINTHAPSGQRIGLAGSAGGTPGLSIVLPLFGPRLGNQVVLVGDRVVHSIALPRTRSAFANELRDGRYDLLVIGLPYAGHTDIWAKELGFRQLARSDRLALYAAPVGL